MGMVMRYEPVGAELFDAYPKCQKRFRKLGWL
jgi:hypothetical protein